MTEKEIMFKYYAWERRLPEHFEPAWEYDQVQYPRTGAELVFDETRDYTQEEYDRLHIFDQRRYIVSGKRVKRQAVEVVTQPVAQALELTAGELPVKGLSPSTIIGSLVVDKPVVIPKGVAHTSLYTAARNKGIKIMIRRNGEDFVIQKYN